MMFLKAAGEYKMMWSVPVDKGALNDACAQYQAVVTSGPQMTGCV